MPLWDGNGLKIEEFEECDWKKRNHLKSVGYFGEPIYDPSIQSYKCMAMTGFVKTRQYYRVAIDAEIETRSVADGVYEAYVKSIEEPIIKVYKYWPPEGFIKHGCRVSGIIYSSQIMKYIMGHEQRRYTVIKNLDNEYIRHFPLHAREMTVISCDKEKAIAVLRKNLQTYWQEIDKQIDMYYFSEEGKISIEMDKDHHWKKNNVAYVKEAPAVISPPPPIIKPVIVTQDFSKQESAEEKACNERSAPPLRDIPPGVIVIPQ